MKREKDPHTEEWAVLLSEVNGVRKGTAAGWMENLKNDSYVVNG